MKSKAKTKPKEFKPKFKAHLSALYEYLKRKRGTIPNFPLGCRISLIHSVQEDRLKEAPDIITGQLYSIFQICNKFEEGQFDVELVIADAEQVFRLMSEKGATPASAHAKALTYGVQLVKALRAPLLDLLEKGEKGKYLAKIGKPKQNYNLHFKFKISMWIEKIFANLDEKYLPPCFDLPDKDYIPALAQWEKNYPKHPLEDLMNERKFSKEFIDSSKLVDAFCNKPLVWKLLKDAANYYVDHIKLSKVTQMTIDEARKEENTLINNILMDKEVNEVVAHEGDSRVKNSLDHFRQELKVFATLNQQGRGVLLYGIDYNPSSTTKEINNIIRILTLALFTREDCYKLRMITLSGSVEFLNIFFPTEFIVFDFFSNSKQLRQNEGTQPEINMSKEEEDAEAMELHYTQISKAPQHHLTREKSGFSNSESSLPSGALVYPGRRTYPMTSQEKKIYQPQELFPVSRSKKEKKSEIVDLTPTQQSNQRVIGPEKTQRRGSYGLLTEILALNKIQLENKQKELEKLEVENAKLQNQLMHAQLEKIKVETEKLRVETKKAEEVSDAKIAHYQKKTKLTEDLSQKLLGAKTPKPLLNAIMLEVSQETSQQETIGEISQPGSQEAEMLDSSPTESSVLKKT